MYTRHVGHDLTLAPGIFREAKEEATDQACPRRPYTVINQFEKDLPVCMLCETPGVSRSAYYAWRQDELGTRRREDNRLMPMIRSVFWKHRRRYGARRIAAELAARREPCGRRRVGRLMARMGPTADTHSATVRTC